MDAHSEKTPRAGVDSLTPARLATPPDYTHPMQYISVFCPCSAICSISYSFSVKGEQTT